MNPRMQLRAHYLTKATFWGVIAAICALPALPYLQAFVTYVQGGLHVGS